MASSVDAFRSHVHVVLCQPRNPLNIGAAARAVANFACGGLRLVTPFDLAFREAVSAVGGAQVLRDARVFENIAEAVSDCGLVVGTTAVGHRELQHPLRSIEQAGPALRDAAMSGPLALLFGSEKFGLTNDELSHCHWLTHIATSPETPSMNLGQAVAVCLHEVVREQMPAPLPPHGKPMGGADAEQLTVMLLEVLRESGYTNRIVADSLERKVRRFLRRANFANRDAPLLLGMLRQILWRFKQ